MRDLLTDDDAVSPVIGVSLMIAITATLAGVIALFVFGVGFTEDVRPNVEFAFDFDADGADSDPSGPWAGNGVITASDTDGTLQVFHTAGEDVDTDELFARDRASSLYDETGSNTDELRLSDSGVDTLEPGENITLAVDSDYDVAIVWDPPTEATSATLARDDGPDA